MYFALLVYGSVFVCSDFYVNTHCKGKTDTKKIALTFDDGPDPDVTPQVLEILRKHNIRGTFFCIGERLTHYKDVGKHIHQHGHLIGNHSFHHGFFFDLLPAKKMEKDLRQTDQEIAAITGQKPEWFRPPYGVTNPALAKTVHRTGHQVAGWSLRSMDTLDRNAETISEQVKSKIELGTVILFHDTQAILPEVMEDVVTFAKEQGYELVRFDELVKASDGK